MRRLVLAVVFATAGCLVCAEDPPTGPTLEECLKTNDVERLLSRYWEKDSARIVEWYLDRFPVLRETSPSGRAIEVFAPGDEISTGDFGGTVVWSLKAEDVGHHPPETEGWHKVTVQEGEFGLAVRRHSHCWMVIQGPQSGAAFLATLDGASSLRDRLGQREAKATVHALLGLTWPGAIDWNKAPMKVEESKTREKLRSMGKPGDGLLREILSCFWGE